MLANDMSNNIKEVSSLLSRVNLNLPLSELLAQISIEFGLGQVLTFDPIEIGYEELNLKLVTDMGIFIIKMFSKTKKDETIEDYIRGMISFREAGIPMPRLLKGKSGYLFHSSGRNGDTFLCVMDYFLGKSFEERNPSEDDLFNLTKYIATIHKINLVINGSNYDSWGTMNLVEEFCKKKYTLSHEDLLIVQPLVDKFRDIDFSKFRKSVIHGDLQRNNILRNESGDYCILDLGCLNYAPSVIDLSVFLAVFCFSPNSPVDNRKRYNIVVSEYVREIHLSKIELHYLPTLIRATYATYLIASNYAYHVNNDRSNQTLKWMEYSHRGLEMFPENMVMI